MIDGYYIATDADTFGPLEYCDTPELSNAPGVEQVAREQVEYRGGAHAVIHVVNGRVWVHGRAWPTPAGKAMFTSCDRMHADDRARVIAGASAAFASNRIVA
jgi:hypothetical protein